MRFNKPIVIASVMLVALTRASALSAFIQVKQADLNTKPFVITAQSEGTNMLFRVVADPSGGGKGAVLDKAARLDSFRAAKDISPDNIMSGSHSPPPVISRTIGATNLPPTMRHIKAPLRERGVLYEFVVSNNALDSSVFSITYNESALPAFTRYWFKLKDFTDAR